MTEREQEFAECVKQDPALAAEIFNYIISLRETSLKTNPVPQQKAV